MRNIWLGLLGLLLLGFGTFLQGCTAGVGYQRGYEYQPYITDVSPSFFANLLVVHYL